MVKYIARRTWACQVGRAESDQAAADATGCPLQPSRHRCVKRAARWPLERAADRLGQGGLAPGERFAEPPLGERAEERIPCQLRAARRRARDACEEARLLSRHAERFGMPVAQRRERGGSDDRLD